jgi:G3E family GTPase
VSAGQAIGLTVIGGFLGAGKTSLLNHWLQQDHGQRLAVLVNDFGAVNIDSALVASRNAQAVELNNGCVCCSIGDDLSAALIALIESPQPPERILIEASGVSDPRPIAQVAMVDRSLSLDGVLVLVDAASFALHADDPLLADTLERQVRAADLLLINRCEQCGPAALLQLQARLEALAPGTPQLLTRDAQLPDPLARTWLGTGPGGAGPARCHQAERGAHGGCDEPDVHHHRDAHADPTDAPAHDQLFETWSWQPETTLQARRLRQLMRELPAGVIRLKGLVHTDEHGLALLQYAGRHGSLRRAPASATQALGLVAIGLRGRLDTAALRSVLAGTALPGTLSLALSGPTALPTAGTP